MISQDDTEKKLLMIMRILQSEAAAIGSRIIGRRMQDTGVTLSERTIRYHLRILDERGFTLLVGRQDGRVITDRGREELSHARVRDKVGLAISRIDNLAFKTSFDPGKKEGFVPMNLSLFPSRYFSRALTAMKPTFKSSLAVSHLVAMAEGGGRIGDFNVPSGQTALATVCSVAINGVMIRRGVPVHSKFGGLLAIRRGAPHRFIELIHYSGSSLDPSEVFILAKMTSARQAAETGNGNILANFREIPADSLPLVDILVKDLAAAGIAGVFSLGTPGDSLCEIPLDINRAGLILLGGLNPVASAHEAGIPVENKAMSMLLEYGSLRSIWDL